MNRQSVLFANWRDTSHPDGGGSERYVERIATGLAKRGYDVSILCPRHRNAAGDSTVAGVRYLRRGGTYTIYLWALLTVLTTRPDVVVDVQNGMPFLSCLVTRRPVLVLVHHTHRSQWRTSFGAVLGRLGWWLESWLAPRIQRRCRYVTVSEHTRADLVALGVSAQRITLIPNGLDPVPATSSQPAAEPTLVAVSRLVQHKRLDHAIEVVARLAGRWPSLRLEIVGRGPWQERLSGYAAQRGVADRVVFRGWVDEEEKHETLARSWIHLCPSAKEGWGIAVVEAAAHGVPSVAYRAAGGVCESIEDERTGLLAVDLDGFVAGVELLLSDPSLRQAMGVESRLRAAAYDWEGSVDAFAAVVAGRDLAALGR